MSADTTTSQGPTNSSPSGGEGVKSGVSFRLKVDEHTSLGVHDAHHWKFPPNPHVPEKDLWVAVHSEACYDLHNNESTDFEYQDDLKKKGFHFFSWHFLWDPGSQITTVDATARDAEGHPLGYDVFETEITSSPSDAWQLKEDTPYKLRLRSPGLPYTKYLTSTPIIPGFYHKSFLYSDVVSNIPFKDQRDNYGYEFRFQKVDGAQDDHFIKTGDRVKLQIYEPEWPKGDKSVLRGYASRILNYSVGTEQYTSRSGLKPIIFTIEIIQAQA